MTSSASDRAAVEDAGLALAEELLAGMGALQRGLRRTGPDWPFGPLTGAQADLLRLVREQPGISVAAAAGELGLAANTVSTLVRQLSEAELLVRTADPADRRVARLDLTETARDRLGRWRDGRAHALADAFHQMPPAQRQLIADAVPALAVLTRELDAAAPKGASRAR